MIPTSTDDLLSPGEFEAKEVSLSESKRFFRFLPKVNLIAYIMSPQIKRPFMISVMNASWHKINQNIVRTSLTLGS